MKKNSEMVFTQEDKAFINNLYLIKVYGLRRSYTGKNGKGLD